MDNLNELFATLSNAVEDRIFGACVFRKDKVADQIGDIICLASEVLKEKESADAPFLNIPPDMTWYRVWEDSGKR
jgi:hypothetical protein